MSRALILVTAVVAGIALVPTTMALQATAASTPSPGDRVTRLEKQVTALQRQVARLTKIDAAQTKRIGRLEQRKLRLTTFDNGTVIGPTSWGSSTGFCYKNQGVPVSAGFWAENAVWLNGLYYSAALNSWNFSAYNQWADRSIGVRFTVVCASIR